MLRRLYRKKNHAIDDIKIFSYPDDEDGNEKLKIFLINYEAEKNINMLFFVVELR